MALLTGFDEINVASNATFTDWLQKTNSMIVLMREDVLTANSGAANTVGNARLIGNYSANIVAANSMSGGTLASNGDLIAANLDFVSNTTFSANSTFGNNVFVYISEALTLETGIIPVANGAYVGNTTNRFDAYLTDLDVSGNVDVSGHLIILGDISADDISSNTLSAGYLNGVAGALQIGSNTTFTGDVDVTGTLSAPTLAVTDVTANNLTANTLSVDSITGTTNNELVVTTNTSFSGDVSITGDLAPTTFTYVIDNTNFTHLIPATDGNDLGNTSSRWDAFVANGIVYTQLLPDANNVALGSTTKRWSFFGSTGDFSGDLGVTGNTTLTNATISGALVVNGAVNFEDSLIVQQDVTANNFTAETGVQTSLIVSANTLTVTPDTTFSGNVAITGDLAPTTFTYTIDNSNFVHLIPATDGNQLGNTSNRWLAKMTSGIVWNAWNPSANDVPLGNTSSRWNIYGSTADFSGDISLAGNTTANNLAVTGAFTLTTVTATDVNASGDVTANNLTANTLSVDSITGTDTGQLSITTNVEIQSNNNLIVRGDLTVNGTFNYTITEFADVIPSTDGNDLGNTTNRWDAFMSNVQIDTYLHPSANAIPAGNTTKRWAIWATDIDATGDIVTTGGFEGANLIITGTANIGTLEVTSLSTNTVAVIGNTATVTSNADTVIDSFPATESPGIKYMVWANTGDEDSVYMLEILCTHSYGANTPYMHFTRYGEIASNAEITLVPDLNGANVELTATCPQADGANTHTFKIMRMEVR